jgi:hypothetical protein
MWMDGEKVGTSVVYAPEDQGCTNVALISVMMSSIKE